MPAPLAFERWEGLAEQALSLDLSLLRLNDPLLRLDLRRLFNLTTLESLQVLKPLMDVWSVRLRRPVGQA